MRYLSPHLKSDLKWYFIQFKSTCYNSTVPVRKTRRLQVEDYTRKKELGKATNIHENKPCPPVTINPVCTVKLLYIIGHVTIIKSLACHSSVCIIPLWLIGILLPLGSNLLDHVSSDLYSHPPPPVSHRPPTDIPLPVLGRLIMAAESDYLEKYPGQLYPYCHHQLAYKQCRSWDNYR